MVVFENKGLPSGDCGRFTARVFIAEPLVAFSAQTEHGNQCLTWKVTIRLSIGVHHDRSLLFIFGLKT